MILRNFISLWWFTVYMENSLRFEISLRSNWPKWSLHRSEFHFVWTHVNSNNAVTLDQSEVSPRSEISNWIEFTSDLMWTCSYTRWPKFTTRQGQDFLLSYQWKLNQHSQNPKKYKKQKLGNKMEVNKRFKAETTSLKQAKNQRNRVEKNLSHQSKDISHLATTLLIS